MAGVMADVTVLATVRESAPVTQWPERLAWTFATVLAIVLIGLLMRRGWRRRVARDQDLPPLPGVAAGHGGSVVLGPVEATYVCTTTAGDWLDRIAAQGLGARATAAVEISARGIRIERDGVDQPLFLPAVALRGVSTAPGMAGKFVGGDGIVVITWAHGRTRDSERLLDTGLHVRHADDSAAVLDQIEQLLADHSPRPEATR